MKDSHKELVETVFTELTFKLSEEGDIYPLYMMIMKDGSLMPIVLKQGIEISMGDYANIAIDAAKELDADAMVFACEQSIVSKAKGDPEIGAMVQGKIKASEHSEAKDHLTLIYMTKDGECESLIGKIHKDPTEAKFVKDQKWIDGSITNVMSSWKEGSINAKVVDYIKN